MQFWNHGLVSISLLILVLAGLMTGSFLTVATAESEGIDWLKRKRSKCANCGHVLGVWDLAPVFSFLWLRGKCRYCGDKIASHHILTELAAVLLFLAAYISVSYEVTVTLIFLLIILTLLLALTLTDLKFWTLPDIFVGLLALVGIARIAVLREPKILDGILGGIIGLLLLGGVAYFSGGKAMGWGDVKLAGAMGVILGFGPLILALIMAFMVGGTVGAIMLLSGRATPKTMVPFGPFLTGATALTLLFPVVYWRVLLFYGLM